MLELLQTIPDGSRFADLEAWLAGQLHAIAHGAADFAAHSFDDLVRIEGADVEARCTPSPFGKQASAIFRRFTAAIFCADLACYTTAADQVNFERLQFVMHTACPGFRLFALRDRQDALLPVGYSAIHAISEATFAQLERADASLANRLIPPLAALPKDQHFCYLFNYSIVAPLRRTACSRQLLRSLAADIERLKPRGLCTITVSEDGVRVAERFGLRKIGSLRFGDLSESVLTVRFS